jgi:hypothetical protein
MTNTYRPGEIPPLGITLVMGLTEALGFNRDSSCW